MTAENWLAFGALAVPVAAALVGIFVYGRQREIDRRAEVSKKRQAVYSDALRAFMRLTDASEQAKSNKAYKAAQAEIMLYGSDEVIRSMASFSRVIDVVDRSEISKRGSDFRPRVLASYGALVRAMRKDLCGSVALTEDELADLGPFK